MNKKSKSTLGKYCQILKVKNYSERTIEIYSHYIFKFFNAFDKPALHITKNDIENYLIDFNYSSINQQNQVISSVKLFVRYFMDFKLHNINGIERPRRNKKLPVVIDRAVIMDKLNSIENIKHKCIVALGYACGLRVSEVVNLKITDIDSKRMLVHIRNAKGKKDRFVKLPENLLIWLRNYYKKFKPQDFLFEGQYGQYTASSCNKIVKHLFGPQFHFHLLRHSFATHNFEAGTDSAIIQNQLGHKRQSTTMIYAHISNHIIQQSASLV